MEDPADFRVLGPVEAWHHGRQITPPPGKPRALLAAMLLRANRFIPVDELIDALWGETPPATVRHALEVHVSRLRSSLDQTGVRRLETRPGGYHLTVNPGELDWWRFQALVGRARQTLAGNGVADAERLLLDADAVWRSSALADVASAPFAGPAIAQLEGARLAAIEDRIELSLALGRHAEVVVELEAMVATEPFRERLRGQLMVALFRCGRQADALRVYHDGRSVLDDELGLDPGAELQRLELSILRQDPELAAPAPAEAAGRAGGGPVPILPERKLVTIMLIRPATAVSAGGTGQLDGHREPDHIAALQGAFAVAVAAELEPTGATVERLAHGVVMAVFGSPVAQEDHADRALCASLAVRDRLAGLPAPGYRAAIGIETGEVIVMSEADGTGEVSGPAIEQAARFERGARVGEILAGHRVLAAARAPYRLSRDVRVAGAAPARRLLGLGGARDPRGAAGMEARSQPFVGRGRELAFLRAAYDRVAAQGEPHLVTVLGDPGIGKSSLVRRMVGELEAGAGPPTVRRGRCLAYGRGVTYAPMAEVLRQQVGLVDGESPGVVRERLGQQSILGLTLGLQPDETMHPLAARNRLEDAWISLIEAAVATRPMVIIVEDVHWAEEPLLELLERIVDDVRGPLLLIAPARPEFAETHAQWITARRNRTTLWLEPLAADEAGHLADRLLGGTGVAAAHWAIERAEGNPFFLEEMLAALTEQGHLRRTDHGWELTTSDAGSPLPDTVRAVLAARIDLLDRRDKEVLQAAAVVGRRFGLAEVEALLGAGGVDPSPIVRRDLVRRLPARAENGEPEYLFKHALTREVAYGSLPIARRARLHEACAARLEAVGGGRDEDAALLAYHAFEAVRPEVASLRTDLAPGALEQLRAMARRWQVRAAELAIGRYAIDDAVVLLEHALALDPPAAERAAIWLAIGRANVLRYDGVGFWNAMQRASDASSTDDERGAIFAELAFETAFRWAIWKRMPERALVDDWIARALALAPPASRTRAMALVARAYWHPHEATAEAIEAVRIARRLGDAVQLSYALDARALTAFVDGRDREAWRWWRQRTGLASRIRDLDHLEDLYGAAIAGHVALARFREARAYARMHDEVAMQLSQHHQVHAVAMHLELEELAGDWLRILALTERTEAAVAANLATPCVRNQRSLLSCALAAAICGRPADAARLEAAAEALAMEGYEAVFDPLRVRLAAWRGDSEAARRLIPVAPPPPTKNWMRLMTVVARLDTLLELGEDELVTEEASRVLVAGTYLEPFARRSLAIVRRDRRELDAVIGQFAAAGLDWHAGETLRLWGQHRVAGA